MNRKTEAAVVEMEMGPYSVFRDGFAMREAKMLSSWGGRRTGKRKWGQ